MGKTIKLTKLKNPKTKPAPVVTEVTDEQRQAVRRESPVHRFVQQLRDSSGVNYLTTSEVADEVGVSSQWVRKIQRQGLVKGVPSLITTFGKINIYLYTPEDVATIQRYLVERQAVYVNPGPANRVESWEDVKNRRERASS